MVVMALLSAGTPALDLTLGAGPAQNCPKAGGAVSFDAAAITYVEPGPVLDITDYGGGHYAPGAGNNRGIGIGFGELAGEVGGFCVGAIYRTEYLTEASRDILDILIANHFGNPFIAGRTYHVSGTDNSFEATGLRVRRAFDVDFTDQWSAKFGIGVSALKGLRVQQESLTGSVTATSPTYAVGTATWIKADSNLNLADFNPFVAPGNPEGYGFSTDFEFIAESKGGSSVDFTVIDALGRLYWSEVPQSLKTLNNATISYDADFNRDALIVGLDSRVSFVQDLVPKYKLAYTVPVVSRVSAVVEDDFVEGYHFPSLGARYGDHERYGEVNFDFRTKAVGIGARSAMVSAMLTSNSILPRNASVLGFSVQALYVW